MAFVAPIVLLGAGLGYGLYSLLSGPGPTGAEPLVSTQPPVVAPVRTPTPVPAPVLSVVRTPTPVPVPVPAPTRNVYVPKEAIELYNTRYFSVLDEIIKRQRLMRHTRPAKLPLCAELKTFEPNRLKRASDRKLRPRKSTPTLTDELKVAIERRSHQLGMV